MHSRAWRFGDNIDTDTIIPARYCNTSNPDELGKHCMEPINAEFPEKVSVGDFIVAGANFGCGSSREHAPIAIKALGIKGVIAKSFAQIFFRNAINIGLIVLQSYEASSKISEGDEIKVDIAAGLIHNLSKEETYNAERYPDFIQEVIDTGGLIPYARKIINKVR